MAVPALRGVSLEINEGEFRRYIDWLIAQGIHGLYPNGSTGEFIRFTPEERRRIGQEQPGYVGADFYAE